jgi:hypothetical protein
MKIPDPFLSIEDPDTFFFVRGLLDFPRVTDESKACEGAMWKSELENLVMPRLEEYEVVLVEDPEGQIRWQGRCFPIWELAAGHSYPNRHAPKQQRSGTGARMSFGNAGFDSGVILHRVTLA